MAQKTDRLELIKVTNGFGMFNLVSRKEPSEFIFIKLSEIVSMTAFEDSTMLKLSNGNVENVQEFVVDIMEALESL